jgi:hypothetical protein
MPESVAFFVCGTPSNHDGFQVVELGPQRLPGSPGSYLDRPPGDGAASYRFESVPLGARRYLEYARVLRINPYDSDANRGAYVAAGCLVGNRLPMHTVANCIDVVSEIYGQMTALLSADRKFPVGFKLAQYRYSGTPLEERLEHQCSPLILADILMQGLNSEGSIDWHRSRSFSLDPAEMLATDVQRYRLYTAERALGEVLSMDERRAQIDVGVEQTLAAASLANELRTEWAALHELLAGGLGRLVDKASEFQQLGDEIERVAERNTQLRSTDPNARDVHTTNQKMPGLRQPGAPFLPRGSQTQMSGAHAGRIGSYGRDAPRVRKRKRGMFAYSRRAEITAYAVIGLAVAVFAVLGVTAMLKPDSLLATRDPEAGEQSFVDTLGPVSRPEQEVATEEAPHSDVVSERAALDDVPED